MKQISQCRSWYTAITVVGVLAGAAAVQAQPPDTFIANPEDAQAFAQAEPFVFEGQALQVNSSFATERPIELQRMATVMVGEGVHFALNGVVSATAAPMGAPLDKLGLGTLALRGANAYTSNTLLREGSLQVAGSSPLGQPAYNLHQQAGTALVLEAGAKVLNHIQVEAARPGDLALPGLEGAAEWRVDAGSASLGRVNARAPVRKTGEGVLHLPTLLQGHAQFYIEAGAVQVDDTAAATFWVQNGARLEGHGSFLHAKVQNGGMLAPGGRDAAANFNALGNVTFEPGSVFHVNAYPGGEADLLQVDGVAELGGNVWAQAEAGDWAPEQRYTILTAGGGLNDTRFNQVDTNLAFLTPALEYEPMAVYLTLTRNDLGLGDVGDTPEDEDVGDAIDPPEVVKPKPVKPTKPVKPVTPVTPKPDVAVPEPLPPVVEEPVALPEPPAFEPPVAAVPLTPLQEAIQGMTVPQAQALLRQANGSWHASLHSMLLEDGRHVRQAVLNSGQDAWHGAKQNTALRPGGLRSWAQFYAAEGRRDARNNVEGDRHSSRGLVLGLDAPLGKHWRPGVLLAAQHLKLHRSAGQASGHADTLHAGLVAHGRWDAMRLTTALLRSWHRIDSRRRVATGPLNEQLKASYLGRSWQAMIEITSQLRRLQPYLRHEFMRLEIPAYEEEGGISAHGVDSATRSMNATTLGGRWRHDWQGRGGPAWLEADLGWRRLWGNGRVGSTQRFISDRAAGQTPTPFSSQGLGLTRNALQFGLEAGVAPTPATRLSMRYSGLYGSERREHAAWADIRWVF